MMFLISAKLMAVQIPIYFKHIVDALDVSLEPGMTAIVPVSLLIGYGLARTTGVLFSELRGAMFAKVTQEGIRQIASTVFGRLLAMDFTFHMNRNTGSLSRALGLTGHVFSAAGSAFHSGWRLTLLY